MLEWPCSSKPRFRVSPFHICAGAAPDPLPSLFLGPGDGAKAVAGLGSAWHAGTVLMQFLRGIPLGGITMTAPAPTCPLTGSRGAPTT